MIKAVLFDLDGTLADTAPDLSYALNLQRQRHGLAFLPEENIRPFASHGSKGLLKIGFNLEESTLNFANMREEYLAIYTQVMTRQPALFKGIAELLQQLEHSKIVWGIVTNKPRRFTMPIVETLGLTSRASVIVCGDDAPQPKPSPQTLLLACQKIAVQPQQVLYVGDAQRDVEAGKAAGMKTVIALFGYLADSDQPDLWGADGTISQPLEVLAFAK